MDPGESNPEQSFFKTRPSHSVTFWVIWASSQISPPTSPRIQHFPTIYPFDMGCHDTVRNMAAISHLNHFWPYLQIIIQLHYHLSFHVCLGFWCPASHRAEEKIAYTQVLFVFLSPNPCTDKNKLAMRNPATSPANLLSSSLAKPTVRRAFLVYTASALVLLIVHILLSYVVESTDPKLRLFVKSRCVCIENNHSCWWMIFRKHPYYLNGRLIFIIISQFVTAIVYGIRNVLLDRFAFKWRIAAQASIICYPYSLLSHKAISD